MGEDRTTPEHAEGPPGRRLTVSVAADELGISAEAVRSRIKRGTLESAKEGSTVYVLLPGHPHANQTTPERDRTDDQTTTEHGRAGGQADLVESLLDQVAYMREQLAEEREARRRADTIIAQLSQANAALARRVPEIEPPSEATGAAESDEDAPYGTSRQEAEDSLQRRPSWWRRFFGLE